MLPKHFKALALKTAFGRPYSGGGGALGSRLEGLPRASLADLCCARVSVQSMLFPSACLLSVTQGYSVLPAPPGKLHPTALLQRQAHLFHRLQKDSSLLMTSEAISWPLLPSLGYSLQCTGICCRVAGLNLVADGFYDWLAR